MSRLLLLLGILLAMTACHHTTLIKPQPIVLPNGLDGHIDDMTVHVDIPISEVSKYTVGSVKNLCSLLVSDSIKWNSDGYLQLLSNRGIYRLTCIYIF